MYLEVRYCTKLVVLLSWDCCTSCDVIVLSFKPKDTKEKKVVPILIIILIIPTLLLGGIRYGQYNQAFEQFITTGKQYAQEFEGRKKIIRSGRIPIMTPISIIKNMNFQWKVQI